MSYGLKYIMQWASQNANANDYRIELYQKDYSGEVTEKKLGSAPSLVMDNADNGIMGTSLQFSIQADIDGELQELYTTDAKKFKCLLFKNDKQIWTGYVLQELYSEDYIAAPYDVGVTATDQLALLKDVPYAPIGRKTVLEIIHNAITPTQLELGYSVQTSLKPQLQDSDIPFISFVTIDDGGYINYSCYEVISMIMRTCNMTITQIENSWVIARKSDISAEIFSYDSALNLIGQAEPNALVIGRMYENDIWPVGNLVRKFTAVPKTLKFAFSPIVKSSFFDNPTMNGPEYWQSNGTYIEQAPGKYKVTVNRLEYNYNVNAWILRSSNRKTKDFALWQSIDVEQGGASLSLKVSYCPMLFISPVTTTSAKKVQEAKLTVQIKLETDSAEVYYMTKEGWKSEDAGDLTYTANPVTDDPRQRGNKDQYSSAVINFPAIPANGVLTISFRNDSVNYIKSEASNMEPFYEPYLMGVTDVMLTAPDVVGYDSDVILNAQGNSSVEQELFFSDAYGIGNEKKSLYNFIRIGDSDTSDWLLGKSTFETFFKAVVQDTANLASLKNHYSGVISGTLQVGLLYYEKFSGDILRMERGTLDLLTEDLNGEWLQVPVSDAVYDEIELNTNENNVVKPASVSTSIPTGNFASTDALDALTKIVNILNTIIGLDDDDNAYVKPKSDGTPRNFYTYGTMSFGGIDDGESGEGGGMGITSLYDIPEIAVSANLADGQSLVYDATLDKWVNRLVQGGSGVDMAYVWAALAAETTEKINASHIPDLSDAYLPLTGGIMTGDLKFANGVGIKAIDIYKNLQIGMYQNNGIFLQGPRLLYSPASGQDFKIWHEGNDGSNSGLDADLLDGLDETRFFRRRSILNSYDSASALSLGLYMLGTAESVTDYFPTGNGTFINLTSTDNSGSVGTNYGLQFCANYAADALYVRSVWYNSLKSWKQLAFTDSNIAGNAASATKLQTSRKIWGQPFNGTADVTGSMYIPNASAIFWKDKEGNDINSLYLTSLNRLILGAGTHAKGISTYVGGFDFRIRFGENADTGLLMNSSGDILVGTVNAYTKTAKLLVKGDVQVADGDFWLASPSDVNINTPRLYLSSLLSDTKSYVFIQGINETAYGLKAIAFFTRDAANYTDEATEKMRISYNGNVGIGTTTPAYKLDVDGTIRGDIMFKTPRTIWGRTFDGTGNITSHLELGNSIAIKVTDTKTNTLRNALVMDSSNSLLIGSGNVASDAGYMTHIYGKPIIFSISSDNHPVTITSNANVLIGTTTENIAYKLNVVGAARISDTLNLGAGVQIGNNALVSFRSKVTETETEAKYYSGLYLSPANNFQIGYGTAITGKFKTNLHGYGIDFRSKGNDSATMSLTIGGNVGIGITNPEYKLDVNGTTRLNGKVTLTKDVVLNNYTAIKFKDFDGVELNTIMVGTDNAVTIGADHAVKNYETRIKGVGVTLFHGNTQVLSLTSTELITAKGITPFVGNTYDLGTASNRWQDIYCYNLDAATRIIMQVPGFTYPCAKIIRDTSTNKVYYQAGLVDGSARQGKMGISGIDATKLASLDINSTLTTISDKLEVNGRGVFNAGVGLAANQFIYTTNSAGGLLKTFGVQDEELLIGLETSTSAKYNTFIYGKNISLKYGGTTNVALTIDEEGNAIFHKYLQSSSDGTHLLDWYGEGRFWNLMPQTTKAHNLGSENKRWASAHINDVVAYNSVKIGDATLVWDAVNQCLVVDKNFVSDGSISFGGLEPPTEDNYLATNGGTILGDLGIGNAANTYKNLNMYGSMYFYLNSNPTAYKMQLWMDGNSRLALRNPTDHAATKFYVYGDIIYNGTSGKPSDMRLKYVVEDVCLSSEIIANAPLFKYKRKDSKDDRIYIGSSAQYWQGVAPELTPLVDDYLTLDYETLGVMMGKSNATEIELLKERMKILEAKVENYERILGII